MEKNFKTGEKHLKDYLLYLICENKLIDMDNIPITIKSKVKKLDEFDLFDLSQRYYNIIFSSNENYRDLVIDFILSFINNIEDKETYEEYFKLYNKLSNYDLIVKLGYFLNQNKGDD